MAAEWVLLGAAVTKLVLRVADESSEAADQLQDASEVASKLRRLVGRPDRLGRAIAQEVERNLVLATEDDRQNVQAAAAGVATLLERLTKDDAALLAAATQSDSFFAYVMRNGGADRRRWVEQRAELAFDRVLRASCEQFAALAPASPRFVPVALTELLEQVSAVAGSIDANISLTQQVAEDARRNAFLARQVADHLGVELDVAAAAATATATGVRVGRPVREWRSDELFVHDAIRVGTASGLVPYVARPHDEILREALVQLLSPGARARMITVVGSSCTGKTRACYEAVRAELGGWRLVQPRSVTDLTTLLQTGVPARTVVWLDELQNFLIDSGVTAARHIQTLLLDPRSPTILFLGTIWPDNLNVLQARPTPHEALRGIGVIQGLLHLTRADQIEVPDEFAPDQLNGMGDDPRLREALAHAVDGQLTQVLAGGAQLVSRFYGEKPRNRREASVRAVIVAAAELRRVGVPNPVPRWAVVGAAPGYLEPQHRRGLHPRRWPEEAIDRITEEAAANDAGTHDIHNRGVPPLAPDWSNPDGDEEEYLFLHDYLLQHHLASRRHQPTSQELWATIMAAANRDRLTAETYSALGSNAALRGMYEESVHLHHAAVATHVSQSGTGARANGGELLTSLAMLMRDWGDEVGLRRWADAGEEFAQGYLAELLAERGDEPSLRARADAGDGPAQARLADLLISRGDEVGLRARAAAGDASAMRCLVQLLVARGDTRALVAEANTGNAFANRGLLVVLVEQGQFDDIRVLADMGDSTAQYLLARMLVEQGKEDELRARADGGDGYAQYEMAALLLARGDEAELAGRADAGDEAAQEKLVGLLLERNQEDLVAVRASRGDRHAQDRLARLLFDRQDEEGLRVRSARGESAADYWLAVLEGEDSDERPTMVIDTPSSRNIMQSLAVRMSSSYLSARASPPAASAVEPYPRHRIFQVRESDEDELLVRTQAGDEFAYKLLINSILARGDQETLRALADAGHYLAQERLASLLAERGNEWELQECVHATYAGAAAELVSLYQAREGFRTALQLNHQAHPRPRRTDIT